jgi:hypothetical protein
MTENDIGTGLVMRGYYGYYKERSPLRLIVSDKSIGRLAAGRMGRLDSSAMRMVEVTI